MQLLLSFLAAAMLHLSDIDSSIDDVFSMIEAADKEIDFQNSTQFIVILGQAGSGRSILSHYMSGNPKTLSAEIKNGDLVYVDMEENISSTKNLFMDIIDDLETSETVIDCHGFMSRDNATYEIASRYFLRKVFQTSKNLKLVLTLPKYAFSPGERHSLNDLLLNFVNLVKDVDKYASGIGLVVTDTPVTKYNDLEEVKFIKNLLLQAKKDYLTTMKETKKDTEKIEITKKIKVINALLDENINKIALFRNPILEGPVYYSTYSMANKKTVRNLVFRSLRYLKSTEEDFTYKLTPFSELFVRDKIYPQINKRITKLLKMLSANIIYKLKITGESSLSILNYKSELDNIYSVLWNSCDINSMSCFEIYVSNIIKYLHEISKIRVKSIEFSNLLQQYNYFRSFTNNNDFSYRTWPDLITSAKNYIVFLRNLYLVIIDTYDVAGTGKIQINKATNFDRDILDMSYSVSMLNGKDFLNKLKYSGLSNYNDTIYDLAFSNMELPKYVIRDLNILLNLIRPNISCSEDTLSIKSNFVSISNDLLSHLYNSSPCKNISTVNILAYEKLFFDGDLNLPSTDVSIIAGNMLFNDNVILNVSGSEGEQRPKQLQSSDGGKIDGLMGLPGYPGGNVFIGTKESVHIHKYLQIVSNGGRGGRGQEGSNGITDYNIIDLMKKHEFQTRSQFYGFFKRYSFEIKYVGTYPGNKEKYIGITNVNMKKYLSGDGGKGGLGGYPGQIKILFSSDGTELKNQTDQGHIGEIGKRWEGGDLQKIDIECFNTQCQVSVDSLNTAQDGINGADERKPTTKKLTLNCMNDIINYKLNILQLKYLSDKNHDLMLFPKISHVYTIQALVTELLQVELIKNNIIPQTLEEYLINMIDVTKTWPTSSIDERQLMVFLTSTISSMIWSNQMMKATVFITNLYDYIDDAAEDIDNLAELGIVKTAENIKYKYSKSMDQNILEAQKYVSKINAEDFDEAYNGIKISMKNLVLEVQDLTTQGQKNIIELQGKKKQLKKNMIAHCILGAVKVAGAALAFVNPVGAVVSVAIGAAATITEKLVVKNVVIDPKNLLTLPKGVENLLKELKEMRGSTKNGHIHVLNVTCEIFLTRSELQPEDRKQVIAVKKNILNIPSMKDLTEAKKIIKDGIKQLKEVSKKLSDLKKPKLSAFIKNFDGILSYADKATQIAEVVLTAVQDYKDDADKLEIVVNMIKKDEQSLKDLSEFEEGIYEAIVPLLNNMQQDLSNLHIEISNKSIVSLEVKRWEVKKYMKKISNTISRFTQGFKVETEFIKYFNQLTEGTSLIITLFEQIQKYQEHKQFANYISDLQSVRNGEIPIDSPYSNELIALKTSIVSSTVRYHCNAIMTSFKQQVFPFAKIYLDSLDYQQGKICDTTDEMVKNTIERVRREMSRIKSRIIENEDVNVHSTTFDSNYVSTTPFAVWDNSTYGRDINKLMEGKEIAVMAPFTSQKNAVKFSKIQLQFKRTDGGPQEELDNELKRFKIEQTHLGNSIYKCDDFTFMIRSEPITIAYGLEMEDGNPIDTNNVYKKIERGDISLSPYTVWRIQLKKTEKAEDFSSLKKFTKQNVELSLCGKGQYLDSGNTICNSELLAYYDVHDEMLVK